MKLENQNIIIVSHEPWGDIWYSKHNWAFELSKKNNVFFVNPPSNWKISNLWNFGITTESYTKTLQIINYRSFLPFTRLEMIYKIDDFIITKMINKWLVKRRITNIIFWTFDPYRFSNPKILSPRKIIFFRVDKCNVKRINRESILLKNCSHLIVISTELIKEIKFQCDYLVLSHGISNEEFEANDSVLYEKNYFLYVGNIDHRLDINLIDKMLKEFPNERFLFIGKLFKQENKLFQAIFYEKKYKNLILHGIEHFKKLKNYIYYSKACLVPMNLEIHGNNINHHKLLQYLAQGKPILAAKFIDYNDNNIVYSYQTHDQGIKFLRDIISLSEPTTKIEARIQFAQKYTYENLIEKVEQFLTESTN